MTQPIRVAFAGAGRPAQRHAEGYRAAGGFVLAAVADLIPARRRAMMSQFAVAREAVEAMDLAADPQIDLLSISLPNHLHAPVALAALKAGKHVVCEMPPTITASEARKLAAAAEKSGKVLLYANQRRFGGAEQAAQQVIDKGFIGDPYHIRVSWMRTRGVPAGTGWFTDPARSGGGAFLDLGLPLLDLAWSFLAQPELESLFAATHDTLLAAQPAGAPSETADAPEAKPIVAAEAAAFALFRFAGNKSLELAASWAINQSPKHQGTVCRIHGSEGALDLYTPQGPLLYRKFGPTGEAKEAPLKLPRIVHYEAMMRHLKKCIAGAEKPRCGPAEGVSLMKLAEAVYRSAETGRSVNG